MIDMFVARRRRYAGSFGTTAIGGAAWGIAFS
jgi:hypothetical protein